MTTNTKTLLTVKIDKSLKANAQKTAEKFGIPLGTLVNSMLRQMVLKQEVNFSLQPSKSTIRAIKQAEKEIAAGDYETFDNVEDLILSLKN